MPTLDVVFEFISSIKLPLTVDSQTGELALAFVLLHVSLEIVNPPVRAWSRSPRILETDVALVGPVILLSTLHKFQKIELAHVPSVCWKRWSIMRTQTTVLAIG